MNKLIVTVWTALAMTAVSASPVLTQIKPKVVTGKAAAMLFTYLGNPIHPFCLGFPVEASSRDTPNLLASCTDSKIAPKSEADGWWSAAYPEEKGTFHLSFPPYISYGVLAAKGDRFLVASESSGGGSGQFSEMLWVRMDGKQVVVVKDEVLGDRCAGGVSGYRAEGSAILYNQATPASEIISLTGVKVDGQITGRLKSGYLDCNGEAHYRYDLVGEKAELTGLSFSGTDTAIGDPNDPQVCYDKLVQQYAKSKKMNLKSAELKKFGEQFAAACGKPNASRR